MKLIIDQKIVTRKKYFEVKRMAMASIGDKSLMYVIRKILFKVSSVEQIFLT